MRIDVSRFLLLSLLIIGSSCGNKPEVLLIVDKSKVRAGDTVRATVESANIDNLIVDFGDSTQISLTQNIPAKARFKHAYDSTGTYYIQAIGITDKDAESDEQLIEVK